MRLTPTQCAYIAGFLDGDGSISARIDHAPRRLIGYRIRPTVTFAQRTKHRVVLERIHEWLRAGSIQDYERKGLSEYVVREKTAVECILRSIEPYLIVKRSQAAIMIEILALLQGEYGAEKFLRALDLVERLRSRNSGAGRKLIQTIPNVRAYVRHRMETP